MPGGLHLLLKRRLKVPPYASGLFESLQSGQWWRAARGRQYLFADLAGS